MTLYQLSSRACHHPATLELLSRQHQIGDAVLILEPLSDAQLVELSARLSEFDCYQLVLSEDGLAPSGDPKPAASAVRPLSGQEWLDLITRADRTVTL